MSINQTIEALEAARTRVLGITYELQKPLTDAEREAALANYESALAQQEAAQEAVDALLEGAS